jgi:hypothetical protein
VGTSRVVASLASCNKTHRGCSDIIMHLALRDSSIMLPCPLPCDVLSTHCAPVSIVPVRDLGPGQWQARPPVPTALLLVFFPRGPSTRKPAPAPAHTPCSVAKRRLPTRRGRSHEEEPCLARDAQRGRKVACGGPLGESQSPETSRREGRDVLFDGIAPRRSGNEEGGVLVHLRQNRQGRDGADGA